MEFIKYVSVEAPWLYIKATYIVESLTLRLDHLLQGNLCYKALVFEVLRIQFSESVGSLRTGILLKERSIVGVGMGPAER